MKILVCGTRFGQFYLEALKRSNEYEVVGILANGSKHSRLCAEKYNTTLYTDINNIPSEIDLACVVVKSSIMGGKGTDIAIRLLEKGINVILEQPVHYNDLVACYKLAKKKGIFFGVGNLYIQLPSVKKFIGICNEIIKTQKPIFLNVDLSTQVSFPLAHILIKAFPEVRKWKVEKVIDDDIPFQILTMKIGDIDTTIRAWNRMDLRVSDNHLYLMHQITLGVAGGRLVLTDTNGAVVWYPKLSIPPYEFIPADLKEYKTSAMSELSAYEMGDTECSSNEKLMTDIWPLAILDDIKRMSMLISGESAQGNMVSWGQEEILSAKLWKEITAALGYPKIYSNIKHEYLPISEIQSNYLKRISMRERYTYLDKKYIDTCVDKLKYASLISILYTLQKSGVFIKKREYELNEIYECTKVLNKYKFIIHRWLKILVQECFLKEKNQKYYLDKKILTEADFDNSWSEAKEYWDDKLGPKIVSKYFYDNARELSQLLSGKIDATLILFPEGKEFIAKALYKETLIAWFLNQQISEAVVNKYIQSEKKLHILEIGAGTGSTTDAVIEKFKSLSIVPEIEYLFTDISAFFTRSASERYKHIHWLETMVIDIEQDFASYDLPNYREDIIIAAGVLNNVCDTAKVLKKLRNLLTDNGIILITEAVGESYQMLISQVFMMAGAEESDTTFLTMNEWIKTFESAGLMLRSVIPDNVHKMAALGQKLFIVSKK